MQEVDAAAEPVRNRYSPLREKMVKHGLPWDQSLLTEIYWSAQHAAAELMRFGMESTGASNK